MSADSAGGSAGCGSEVVGGFVAGGGRKTVVDGADGGEVVGRRRVGHEGPDEVEK
jgi:hypothetical protein